MEVKELIARKKAMENTLKAFVIAQIEMFTKDTGFDPAMIQISYEKYWIKKAGKPCISILVTLDLEPEE